MALLWSQVVHSVEYVSPEMAHEGRVVLEEVRKTLFSRPITGLHEVQNRFSDVGGGIDDVVLDKHQVLNTDEDVEEKVFKEIAHGKGKVVVVIVVLEVLVGDQRRVVVPVLSAFTSARSGSEVAQAKPAERLSAKALHTRAGFGAIYEGRASRAWLVPVSKCGMHSLCSVSIRNALTFMSQVLAQLAGTLVTFATLDAVVVLLIGRWDELTAARISAVKALSRSNTPFSHSSLHRRKQRLWENVLELVKFDLTSRSRRASCIVVVLLDLHTLEVANDTLLAPVVQAARKGYRVVVAA